MGESLSELTCGRFLWPPDPGLRLWNGSSHAPWLTAPQAAGIRIRIRSGLDLLALVSHQTPGFNLPRASWAVLSQPQRATRARAQSHMPSDISAAPLLVSNSRPLPRQLHGRVPSSSRLGLLQGASRPGHHKVFSLLASLHNNGLGRIIWRTTFFLVWADRYRYQAKQAQAIMWVVYRSRDYRLVRSTSPYCFAGVCPTTPKSTPTHFTPLNFEDRQHHGGGKDLFLFGAGSPRCREIPDVDLGKMGTPAGPEWLAGGLALPQTSRSETTLWFPCSLRAGLEHGMSLPLPARVLPAPAPALPVCPYLEVERSRPSVSKVKDEGGRPLGIRDKAACCHGLETNKHHNANARWPIRRPGRPL
ncbi:hypothetical protein B0T24DRAFT_608151 [Lasiosphaeria ovina]|uniref:Uncharacterized protein n=1 Tax=Lasiosphaeria ovina TaxID=92902 RepID=A0AAE0TYJ9_9PEZI|nr:hypothetical protein B0T24DRAFT_608151 [Lasiosphaeria ovina]